MFGPPLDVLLMFALTTPLIGWISTKIRFKSLCGVYAVIGLSASGYEIYRLGSVFIETEIIVLNSEPFYSCLRIDYLSFFMALIFILLGFIATLYSIKYMEKDSGVALYYTLLLIMIFGLLGVVFSGDFFTLYIFWELMCIASYALVAFR